jgi:hypothetical protein
MILLVTLLSALPARAGDYLGHHLRIFPGGERDWRRATGDRLRAALERKIRGEPGLRAKPWEGGGQSYDVFLLHDGYGSSAEPGIVGEADARELAARAHDWTYRRFEESYPPGKYDFDQMRAAKSPFDGRTTQIIVMREGRILGTLSVVYPDAAGKLPIDALVGYPRPKVRLMPYVFFDPVTGMRRVGGRVAVGEVLQLMELAVDPSLKDPLVPLLYHMADLDFRLRPDSLKRFAFVKELGREAPLYPAKYVAYSDDLLYRKLYRKQGYAYLGSPAGKPGLSVIELDRSDYLRLVYDFKEHGKFDALLKEGLREVMGFDWVRFDWEHPDLRVATPGCLRQALRRALPPTRLIRPSAD